MQRFRPRLTYANVMVTVLAFIVLGGGAYAASKVPKNSVGTKQIRKGAIRPSDLSGRTKRLMRRVPGPPGAAGQPGSPGIAGPAGASRPGDLFVVTNPIAGQAPCCPRTPMLSLPVPDGAGRYLLALTGTVQNINFVEGSNLYGAQLYFSVGGEDRASTALPAVHPLGLGEQAILDLGVGQTVTIEIEANDSDQSLSWEAGALELVAIRIQDIVPG